MRAGLLHKVTPTSISLLFLASVSFAVIVHDTVRYERPVRSIRGRVTGYGQVVPVFWVDVYDNAQVSLDNSMPPVEKRKKQTKVASVEPNERGEFNIKHLPKGFYEVEFGNHGGGGYNDLSVLVNVDPKGTNDKLCVDVSLESGPGQNTATKCGAQ
jgi:hypothetical protein